MSAEIEVVPAGRARDAGFDRSMVLAYGHDDKVCAFPSYKAMLEMKAPARTSCCILVDKEEIGSVGATGMQSRFFENCVAELMNAMGQYSELSLRRSLAASYMLSSDVTAGYDPTYASRFDKKNVAYMGRGLLSISLPEQGVSPVLMMPMQNMLVRSEGLWMRQKYSTR